MAGCGQSRDKADTSSSPPTTPTQDLAAPHLARFSVTLRKASCFLARFLAAASLAIFRPSRSLRPGSKIYKAAGMWVAYVGPVTKPGSPLPTRTAAVDANLFFPGCHNPSNPSSPPCPIAYQKFLPSLPDLCIPQGPPPCLYSIGSQGQDCQGMNF